MSLNCRFILPERQNPIFQSIEEFQMGKQIGDGGFSKVYEGTHKNTQKKYAIKVVDFRRIGTLDQENIQREIEAHKLFNHQNIVKLIDFFQKEKFVYLILELCNNGSIYKYLKNKKMIPLKELQKYILQTCHAIDYIHKKNFIMRDIKPENLLLDENYNIKLCDFGWTASLSKDDDYRKIKAGTFAYMSPESLKGNLQDKESDFWAIGILLYELFNGTEPYGSISCEQQFERIQKEPKFSEKKFPQEVKYLIRNLMKINPKQRFNIEQILKSDFLTKTNIDDPRLKYPQNTFDGNPLLEGMIMTENGIQDPLLLDPSQYLKKNFGQNIGSLKKDNIDNVIKKFDYNIVKKGKNNNKKIHQKQQVKNLGQYQLYSPQTQQTNTYTQNNNIYYQQDHKYTQQTKPYQKSINTKQPGQKVIYKQQQYQNNNNKNEKTRKRVISLNNQLILFTCILNLLSFL